MSSGFQEEDLPKKVNFGVWLKISRYALRHKFLFVVAILGTLFSTFHDSSFIPVMNAASIDLADRIGQGLVMETNFWLVDVHATFLFGIEATFPVYVFVILLLVGLLLRCLAIYVSFYSLNLISMNIVIDLRRDTFERIQELSFSYFDKNSSGWLIARMQSDTSTLSSTLVWSVNSILWSAFEIAFSIGTMFSTDWKFSLLVLASLPIVFIVAPLFEKAILVKHRIARQSHSAYVSYLAESISGAKTIKSLSLEDSRIQESEAITSDLCEKRYKAHLVNAFFNPVLSLISGMMVVIIIFFGNHQIDRGLTTAATVVLFLTFVRNIYDPITGLAETMSEFMASQAGAEKVIQLLEAKVEIKDTPEVIEAYGDIFHPKEENYPPFHGNITFENVTFDYGNGIEVIHPLSLEIPSGQSIAIVGETGSGKTTLVNLLCRFYEPTSGNIYLDGREYRTLSLGYLRHQIGYVQQNPFVFKGTYAENIRYGKEDATQEEIEAAAKAVGIHDFILSEPDGYNTECSLGGDALSQGQRQLIAFARALLRNPALLILDEATSSIDTLTEAHLQGAVNKMLKGRTSILIAHRLSTVVNCDRILFLEKGYVVEDGSHEELMRKKGHYYDLFMSQFEELSIDVQMEVFPGAFEA